MKRYLIAAVWMVLSISDLCAQTPKNNTNNPVAVTTDDGKEKELLTTTTVPTIQLNARKPETVRKGMKGGNTSADKKEKSEKGNVYYGVKATKTFLRTQKGKNVIIEKFSFLKEYKEPSAMAEGKYYFDKVKRKVVRTTGAVDKENGLLLHGRYTKTYNDSIILEDGYYYYGVKDGKWEKFDKDFVLLDKRYYNKGMLRDTEISYFDEKKTRIKEFVPIHNGMRDGEYTLYYPSGRIAEKGMYVDGVKVGKWVEYYDQVKYARKKETMHREKPYDDAVKPYTIREWDEKGKVITDNSKGK